MRNALALTLLLMSWLAHAGVYKWVDEKGVVHYGEQPPAGKQQVAAMGHVQNRVGAQMQVVCSQLRDLVPTLMTGMRNELTRADAMAGARAADQRLARMGLSDANLRKLVDLLYGYRRPAASGARLSGNTYYSDDLAFDEMRRAMAEVHTRCLSGAFGSFDQPPDPQQGKAMQRAEGGASSGTGFFVSPTLVATRGHVGAGGTRIEVTFDNGQTAEAYLLRQDSLRDLALLKVQTDIPHRVLQASAQPAHLGEPVFTVGFPQIDIMGTRPKLATGVISSLSGIRDDDRTYQISVPVQSGNSGGPLVNANGQVVGVVAAKLNAAQVFEWTGDLPQNVNYAVKSTYLVGLLGTPSETGFDASVVGGEGVETLAPQVQDAIVRITVR